MTNDVFDFSASLSRMENVFQIEETRYAIGTFVLIPSTVSINQTPHASDRMDAALEGQHDDEEAGVHNRFQVVILLLC